MLRLSLWALGLVVVVAGSAHAQGFSFRQDNTALPPFGGYVPGSGAVITSSPGAGVTYRQGSADVALPPFGGYVPGTGARIEFGNPAQATAMRQRAAVMANRARQVLPRATGGSPQTNAAPARVNAAPVQAIAAPVPERQDVARAMRRERAAQLLLEKGNQAVAKGNLKLARRYFLEGLKRDAPEVNETLRGRLAQISDAPASQP